MLVGVLIPGCDAPPVIKKVEQPAKAAQKAPAKPSTTPATNVARAITLSTASALGAYHHCVDMEIYKGEVDLKDAYYRMRTVMQAVATTGPDGAELSRVARQHYEESAIRAIQYVITPEGGNLYNILQVPVNNVAACKVVEALVAVSKNKGGLLDVTPVVPKD